MNNSDNRCWLLMLCCLLCLSVGCFSSLLRLFVHQQKKGLVSSVCARGVCPSYSWSPHAISFGRKSYSWFQKPKRVLHKCSVPTEMFTLTCQNDVPICHADTKALHLIFLTGDDTLRACCAGPVVLTGVVLRGTAVCDLRFCCPSWRAAGEAAIMALLENNSCFFLSNFVHGFWSLCSLSFPSSYAMLLCGSFLASGNYYCKDYFSSIPAFETPIRHFTFKPF